jgi:hypothetical protein
VIVCFVDIGGIDGHHCSNFHFVFSEHKNENLNNDGHQFHQYQKKTITSHLSSMNTKKKA